MICYATGYSTVMVISFQNQVNFMVSDITC